MNSLIEIDSENSRVRAAFVNSGRFSFQEAEQSLIRSRLEIVLGPTAADTPAGQAAFLTAVVTAARCFGAVTVSGATARPLLVPLPIVAKSVEEAALKIGAQRSTELCTRRVFIGPNSGVSDETWSVQSFWDGWIAGVTPGREPKDVGPSDCELAGVAAGALSVAQAFLAEQGDLRAGRSAHQVSLWEPQGHAIGATEARGPESIECLLPLELWLVGLGNLGQAYLWSLSMLPYSKPEKVTLYFQDDDIVKRENWGTSILVERGRYGDLKTRLAEQWALARSFNVRRIDRRLDKYLRRTEREPAIALAGLDRMLARRLLGVPGFEYVVDAGLGASVDEYRKFRLNVFNAARDPANHFEQVEDRTTQTVDRLMAMDAYKDLIESGATDPCGAAMLAEQSVAVPFVSAVAGAFVIAQCIRLASGLAPYATVTGEVGDVRSVRATLGEEPARLSFPTGTVAQSANPGLTQPARCVSRTDLTPEGVRSDSVVSIGQ